MSHCHTCEEKKHQPSCHGGHSGKKRFDLIFWGSLFSVGLLYGLGAFFPEKLHMYPWLETMAHTSHSMIHAIWWGVLVGAIFVGILSKVPKEFVMSLLGRGGTVSGLLRATCAGVLLDLCSHGILMVGTKLYERGASAGQVIAFLLASPWNSFSLTLVLIGLIGWQWTLAFIVLSMVIALFTGWIFDKLVGRGTLPQNHNEIDLPQDFQFWTACKEGLRKTSFNMTFFKEMAVSGIKDSRMVVRWLLFGILLAAILRASLDTMQFQQFFGPTTLGLVITIAVATVLEVCSEGSTPIAADILTRAAAPGNGFAFLMAGVATDYTEIMVLRDTTKSWKIPLFLPLVSVPQVLAIAWLMNAFG